VVKLKFRLRAYGLYDFASQVRGRGFGKINLKDFWISFHLHMFWSHRVFFWSVFAIVFVLSASK
jgi:hypothetical protein